MAVTFAKGHEFMCGLCGHVDKVAPSTIEEAIVFTLKHVCVPKKKY